MICGHSFDPNITSSAISGLLLWDRLHQIRRFHAQSVRQFDDVEQADVAFAALDSADVVAMQVGQLRQALLG